ncbi:hypothetical protein MTE01_17440 [Microbacterium testaceum]|uniref:RiboL-PSP-HEPN domain-containing protein n=2 Tax=Microbacterium testaceum TaxID=2033 RepID=A0A4Y3QLI2_MICTE|nr:hypothetical protein MTE01_17440 [Microbacterium testaceum]
MDPGSNQIRELVWVKASTNAVSTWKLIQETYKNWFDVKGIWAEIDRLLEARNAIAHGLGSLTRTQQKKGDSARAKITAAGIAIVGTQIQLTEQDLERARNVCRNLIEAVDKGVSSHPLAAVV